MSHGPSPPSARPWDDWHLDANFFNALVEWHEKHPETKLSLILERIQKGLEKGKDLVTELIPDLGLPIPVKGIILALCTLLKWGVQVKVAKQKAYAFVRDVVGWIVRLRGAFRRAPESGRFTNQTWESLEEMRDLVDTICRWAHARLLESGWQRLKHGFSVENDIQEFQSQLQTAKSTFTSLSLIMLGQAQDAALQQLEHAQNDMRILIDRIGDILAKEQLDTVSKTLQKFTASRATYLEQGRKKCDDHTRTEVLERIIKWVPETTTDSTIFLWLSGDPGIGKSSIAASISHHFDDSGILGAQFFASIKEPSTMNPLTIFPSLALQLAGHNRDFMAYLYNILGQVPASSVFDDLESRMRYLFTEPLQYVYSRSSAKTVLIVIDGLDECYFNTQSDLARTLAGISTPPSPLPRKVKVLISSRKTRDFETHFRSSLMSSWMLNVPLSALDATLHQDVTLYLRTQIHKILEDYEYTLGDGDEEWQRWYQESEDLIKELSRQASGIFVWAVTAAGFLRAEVRDHGTESFSTLLETLTSEGMGDVRTLYRHILNRIYYHGDKEEVDEMYRARQYIQIEDLDKKRLDDFHRIMGVIIVLIDKFPVSLREFKQLLQMQGLNIDIITFASNLRTLIIPDTDTVTYNTVPSLHQSVVDFLGTNSPYRINQETAYQDVGPSYYCLFQNFGHLNYLLRASHFGSPTAFRDQARVAGRLTRTSIRRSSDFHDDTTDHHTLDQKNGLLEKIRRTLSRSLFSGPQYLGDLSEINESILNLQSTLRLTPYHHHELLNNLGSLLSRRFERRGNLYDLNESILMFQEAVHLTPDGQPHKLGLLSNLGTSLLHRFEHFGDLNDVNNSILILEDVIRLTPDGHPERPIYLNNLGNSLVCRFESLGTLNDIDESILVLQDALCLIPDGHPHKPVVLNNLGNSLLHRFECLGTLSDINKPIQTIQDAIRLTPDGHPDKPVWLNNLGNSLLDRFEHLGNLRDIEESILMFRDAVHLTPDDHPDKTVMLSNLGSSLSRRFERIGNVNDIEESILMLQNVMSLTPDGHPHKPVVLSNLGSSLLDRFHSLGDPSDIDKSILMLQNAMSLTPDGHPNKSVWLNNLGNSLLRRFERLGNLSDIHESILIFQNVIHLTPESHLNRLARLNNLGNSLFRRFEHHKNIEDATLALEHFSSAAQGTIGPPATRFQAAFNWLCLARQLGHFSILDAHSTILRLLPELVRLGSPILDRHFQLRNVSNIVRSSVAAAIEAHNDIVAVEWLEQGRSIIWGQILQLRTPIDALRASNPEVASRLEWLSSQLENVSTMPTWPTLPLDPTHSRVWRSLPDDYETLAYQRNRLIDEIRTFHGFEQFLLPKSFSDLRQAADEAGGPVIMLNASLDRCDALVLMPYNNLIRVPLPDMSEAKAIGLQKGLQELLKGGPLAVWGAARRDPSSFKLFFGSQDIHTSSRQYQGDSERWFLVVLFSLWIWVVEPIVKELHLTTDHLTRIWWCPAGAFSFLPLHAAGDHFPNAPLGSKLSDYAISSYIPSVTVFLQALNSRPAVSQAPEVLVVANPATSGLPPLPVTTLTWSEATIDKVKEGMKTASHIHFACHGMQDVASPMDSALLLSDSRLTLSDIISMKLDAKDLAFLSAVETAAGDKQLPDEAVHLAAGMLLAGYRGVIATMWQIRDEDAPRIADDVYKVLFQDPQSATKAAEALHFAVKNLRESGVPCSCWVPFIHLGI